MSLPTVSLTGNIKNMQLKYSQSGKAINTFALECSEKNKDGSWDNLYIKVTTFDKVAEFINSYFKEGSVAIVTGKLVTKVWEKTDGTKQYDITFKFPNVEFPPKDRSVEQIQDAQQRLQQAPQQDYKAYQSPQHQQGQQQHDMPNQLPGIDIDDDEIPFAPIGLQYPMALHVI